MKSSDTGITYTLDSLGSSFRLKSYNKLRKTMLPAFPVYHALESHRIEENQLYTVLQTNKHRWELEREPTKGYCWFSRSHIFRKMTGNVLNLIFFFFWYHKKSLFEMIKTELHILLGGCCWSWASLLTDKSYSQETNLLYSLTNQLLK